MKIMQKQPDRDFVILNLTDPQLGNEEWQEGHKNRRILETTVRELVERVRPDLITVSGDLAWAGHDLAYDMLADFLDSFGVPWAPVWGNHDNQNGAESVESVVARYLTHPYCIYERGEPEFGNGNYIILIEENGAPIEAIFMLDSHDREPYQEPDGSEERGWGWARLSKAQVSWFKEQTAALKAQGCKDATVILHIPIYAYRLASRAAYNPALNLKEITLAQAEGATCWNEGYTDSTGVQYEGVASYPEEDGMFAAIQESEITKYVLAGHDHINNWIIRYEGVCLTYALKTGAGCYWNPSLNGGTVLKINRNGVYDIHHEYVDTSSIS